MNKTTLNSQKEKHFMLSLRRATPRHRRCTAFRTYFYPRPPCGERLTNKRLDERERNFYPRSPCGERPPTIPATSLYALFFYPRSPCGERLAITYLTLLPFDISIHALLAESDLLTAIATLKNAVFLSTLSLRRATFFLLLPISPQAYFYPRSPCGERHPTAACRPRAVYFYPRSPCGERLIDLVDSPVAKEISIHALLAESDSSRWLPCFWADISIHALLAESDLPVSSPALSTLVFLSTLSLRRATSAYYDKIH